MSSFLKASKKKTIQNIRTMWESKSHDDFVHQLDLEMSFIDYFLILGIDPKISINNYLYTTSPKDLDEHYQKEIVPEILTKIPPIKKSYINIDDIILSLCFPNGFHLEEFNSPPKPQYLTFLLDNNFFSTEHPHKYITCLLFYENLKNYYYLKEKIKKEIEGEDEELLKTLNSGSMIDDENIDIKNIERYYFPKVICLISIEQFYKEHKEVLAQIFKYFLINKNKANIPLEKIIIDIIKNIPTPPFGIMEIKYKINDNFNDIIIKRNQINRITNYDEYLENIFSNFSIDTCLDIFRYTLFEIKTIVFCKNINTLCRFIYGLINLLFPFKYPFQVSSCLPKSVYHFLDSISPYIFGVNEKYSEEFVKKYINSPNINVIIIDLQNKKIIEKLDEKLPDFPKIIKKKLKSKIEKLRKGNSLNSSKTDDEGKKDKKELDTLDIEQKSISFIFFSSFFINIMINYSSFLNKSDLKHKNRILNIKNLYKINDFVNSHAIPEKAFYKRFVETQMFNDFIFKKMIPNNINEKIEILFFDECINRKKNKMKFSVVNKNTPFLKSKDYEYSQIYTVPKTEPITPEEKEKFENSEFFINSLLSGAYIENEKFKENNIQNDNNNIINNNDISIHYYLFPKFNEDYFNDIKCEYFSFSSMKEDIHHINTDILSKTENSHFKEENDNKSMVNYVYLTYIELWAYSFYYHEDIEKNFKFKQLLSIIDKLNNHEIEIYSLLFESLNKNGENEKILELYDKLYSHKISPNTYIYSLIEGIKKNNKDISNDGKKNKFKRFLSFKKNSSSNKQSDLNKIIYKFKLRTFKADNELNILGEKVFFEAIQKCAECSRKINIYNLCLNSRYMIKNELWARCPYCKTYFLPSLRIYLGKSFPDNKISNYKMTKCFLHSPYELKKNIRNIFDEEKKNLLDIDNFKNNYPDLFWSCVWYFFLIKIDFSFFLPYENNINKFTKNILLFSNIESIIEQSNIDIKKEPKIKKKKEIKKYNKNNLIIQSLISIKFILNNPKDK